MTELERTAAAAAAAGEEEEQNVNAFTRVRDVWCPHCGVPHKGEVGREAGDRMMTYRRASERPAGCLIFLTHRDGGRTGSGPGPWEQEEPLDWTVSLRTPQLMSHGHCSARHLHRHCCAKMI